ncbi:MAG TPA: DUF411 domain-containing protein [Longimicrobiaceae bacterium]|nr:DUF411 domain-containing protein [Longimicrobiaceae bacterium]
MTALPVRALAGAALLLAAAGCGGAGGEAVPAERTPVAQAPAAGAPAPGPVIAVYKTPSCGCCRNWVDHVRAAGFQVEVHDMPDVQPVKTAEGVPGHLASCHTAKVGGYVVEGHVPADLIRRLLAEKPAVAGLAVPGMPMGSPGMEGPYAEHYDVIAFSRDGQTSVYASR